MQDFCKFSDEELLYFLKSNNAAAFEEIYNRYWSKLYVIAYKRVQHREVAEEIVQDFFTSFWINREKIQIHTLLKAYMFTSIKYLVLNHIKKNISQRTYSHYLNLQQEKPDFSTEENILLNDLKYNLEREVNLLPPKCRKVYELSRNENKSNKEISVELSISEKTVENHITRALRQLKVGLSDLIIVAISIHHYFK